MEAPEGAVTCVMGTNGVGKTSLLKAIAGAHPRSGGDIWLDGEALGPLPAQALAKKGVGYVPQGRDIFPLLTVRENLETGFACLPKSEHFVPDEIFELFPILKQFLARRGGDLSGGQQQQLAIARALITKPKLLLLDEPTEGIQPNIIQQIGDVIEYLRGRGGMAIVLVEQYFDFAWRLADSFTVLERGRVTLQGTKAEMERDRLLAAVSV
jgi:urea transport system ATP-binding protein